MKFSSSFLLTVVTLLSTSSGFSDVVPQTTEPSSQGTDVMPLPEFPETQVEGASGCSKDHYCWGSCKVDSYGDGVFDEDTAWEPGRPWCWVEAVKSGDWIKCIRTPNGFKCALASERQCFDKACLMYVE